MKKMLLVLLVIASAQIAKGQGRVENDPSYSVNNYKHPNKAKYAKQYFANQSLTLEMAPVTVNDNYKQPHATPQVKNKAIFHADSVANNQRRSYKHPNGL